MAGLGILIYSLFAGAAAIGRGIENEKVKSQTYKIDEKGRPTYMDRYGKEYINGERVIPQYDYQQGYTRYVGQRTGTVYRDYKREYQNKIDLENEERKQSAIKMGKLSYAKYNTDWKQYITTEISTERPIAILFSKKGKYWKDYGKDVPPKYWIGMQSQWNYRCAHMELHQPIEITEEEFENLNMKHNSSHSIQYGYTPEEWYKYEKELKEKSQW